MITLVIAALFIIGGAVAAFAGATKSNPIALLGGIVAIVVGVGVIGFNTFYKVDSNEAVVVKNMDGTVAGSQITPGFASKAPWQDTVSFDTLNQSSVHSAFGDDDKKDGSFITTQDANGVTADYDVEVRYSVRPGSVEDIYSEYREQPVFKERLIISDIRSVVRAVPNGFSTIDVLTKRGDIEKGILAGLEARWEKEGVQVESVALQEIRYPEDVQARLKDAQNASTDQEKAKIALETAKINEQQKVVIAQADADAALVKAKAEAEANRLVDQSLTPEVLQNRKLDTMKEVAKGGNLIITDGEGSSLLNIPAPAAK